MATKEYAVEGMHCHSCEMLVIAELEDAGAANVTADHTTGKVTFDDPDGALDDAAVKAAVEAAGFALA